MKRLDESLKGNLGLKVSYFFKSLEIISFKLVGSSAKTDSKQDNFLSHILFQRLKIQIRIRLSRTQSGGTSDLFCGSL